MSHPGGQSVTGSVITLTLAEGYPGELFDIEHCCRYIFSAWEHPAGGAL